MLFAGVRAQGATINPLDFLVGSRCADGSLPLVSRCAATRRQQAGDPMRWRRHDWPAPDGYQIEDAFIAGNGTPELIWSYPPFRRFVAADGDGGETYAVDRNGVVTITGTQDGGRPGLQHFAGASCGGSGWLVFKADVPTGRWAGQIASLADVSDPASCRSLDTAFTRWRLERVAIPFVIQGRAREMTVSTIISEHYDGSSIAQSRHLERSFFGLGFGRLVWEAWGPTPPTVSDLPARCPMTRYSLPPAPGWQLEDCRYATNIVAADGSMSGEKFGWPQ